MVKVLSIGGLQIETLPRQEFRPVKSIGVLLGAALAVVSLLLVFALVTTTGSAAPPTRALGLVLALLIAVVGAVGAFGAVECATLTYALGRAGLEVRSAIGWVAIRYDQIDAIESGASIQHRRPLLWPGALFGFTAERGQRPRLSRSTTNDPAQTVLIAGGRGAAVVITPTDATGFKAVLIQRARGAARGHGTAAAIRPSWIDRVAAADAWFRAGCVAALFIAALDVIFQVSRISVAPRHSFAAVAVIAINTILGYTVLLGLPGAARLLVGTTLCGQVIAMLW